MGLSTAGVAGTWTGQLISPWMSHAPTVDGQIQAAEWAEAVELDLGQGVALRIGHDARTLYLAVLDPRPAAGQNHALDRLVLFFDDESGTVPQLDDNNWGGECHSSPVVGDGEISFAFSGEVDYVEWWTAHAGTFPCPAQPIGDRLSSAVAPQGVGVGYEIALPLDGPAPLHAAPGQRFGFTVQLIAPNSGGPLCYFDPCDGAPFSYQNLVLASWGCNTGPQDFGSGNPPIGLPLDWAAQIDYGSGQSWVQSLPPFFGDPVFCQGNETGGSGAAACAANVFYTSPLTRAALIVPVSLAGQTSATLRARATLVLDPNGLSTDEFLRMRVLSQDGTLQTLFIWSNEERSETVVLPLPFAGSHPIELWIQHRTQYAGGVEGGFGQIDDAEILCGPVLFADGFESGLPTHWSADTL